MKHVAAYLLAQLGGNDAPSADDIKTILGSVGIEADEEKLTALLTNLAGRDITEVIAAGRTKMAAMPVGGGGGGGAVAPAAGGGGGGGDAAAGGGGGGAAAEEKKEEEEEEEEEVCAGPLSQASQASKPSRPSPRLLRRTRALISSTDSGLKAAGSLRTGPPHGPPPWMDADWCRARARGVGQGRGGGRPAGM